MEKCTFSTVTQKYLDSYAGILDTMTGTMNCAKENDSISYNFIVKMIPHHQAAIRISEELLRYTTCIPATEYRNGNCCDADKGNGRNEKNALRMRRIP